MAQNNQNGKMSREEAGRKGGEATSKSHDREFYQEIGREGGSTRGNNDGNDDQDRKMSREEAGRKGGQARSRNRKN
ncbi:glucose starvation-inducible protein B [Paenibacillus sp. ALJ109b]|uniref:KGG domain-containing protein n=1 Tax=Paenibacillus sp. ALJ109b TaxID=2709068 RepID=UPI0013D82879|nr:glucose starvation-inducible protein B [Paenibacillus sp. ALJ109b]NEU59834.1 glucose starvation-inducible protein B [Paenibacillus sp. ALJ109b]